MKFTDKVAKFFKETFEKLKKFAKVVIADKKKLTIAIAVIAVLVIGLPVTLAVTLPREGKASAGLMFTPIDNGKAYSVSRGTATDGVINIPSKYKGKPVTQIAPRGFADDFERHFMASIVIPNSVTSIGNDAFTSCYSLTSVTMSNNLTYIGDRAFKSCENLKNIVIPNSVTYIGEESFYGCRSLTDITLLRSSGITRSDFTAFLGCDSLTNIYVPAGLIVEYKNNVYWNDYADIIKAIA